jgi:DNA-binding NtrC family response regulator
MSGLWIVHRNTRQRAALARLAAAPEDAVLGAPGDLHFDAAALPDVILLGLDGDWEIELEYAHAVQRRVRDAHWILLGPPGSGGEALRLFDTLLAEYLVYPPTPELLRERICAARRVTAPALSQRATRQLVAERFSRWFADLELPELLRALDPRLADVPVLIRGEPGTGRGVLAQYIHLFGGTAAGAFVHVPCTEAMRAEEILSALAEASRGAEMQPALTIWLDEVERLPADAQLRIREWIESGIALGTARAPLLRWIATTGEAGAGREPEAALCRAMSDLAIRLPPLRERPHLVAAVTGEASRLWCEARQARARRFGEDALAVMEEYPWPGNLRELEAVVVQTLSSGTSDPVRSDDLQYGGQAFAPLGAGEVGSLIVDAEPIGGAPAEVEDRREEWPDLVAEAELEAEPEPRAEPERAAEPELEAEPELAAEPELVAEAELVAEPELVAKAELVAEPELVAEAELVAEPELVAEAELVAEPDLVAEPELAAEPELVAEAEFVAEPELVAEAALLEVEAEEEATAASAEPEPAPAAAEFSTAPVDEVSLARLVASLSHEVRNPLATIRTFASLLPERFDDSEFRERFAQIVSQDVERIDALVEQLGRLSDLQAPKREAVDVSQMLEELLDDREETIRQRRLLVLKELDGDRGIAVADREQLRFAFEALLGKSLELVPERGDVYLASRYHGGGPTGSPSVRVLLRFHDRERAGAAAPSSDLSLAENSLELTIAELVIRAQGGSFALTTTEGKETVIVVDLTAR